MAMIAVKAEASARPRPLTMNTTMTHGVLWSKYPIACAATPATANCRNVIMPEAVPAMRGMMASAPVVAVGNASPAPAPIRTIGTKNAAG